MATFGGQARTAARPRATRRPRRPRERAMAAAARAVPRRGRPGRGDRAGLRGGPRRGHRRQRTREECPAPQTLVPRRERETRAETQLALIPYSYPRLSEQAGYGAGNRAPWYYQQVWELGGDYGAATRRALVVAARHLRERGTRPRWPRHRRLQRWPRRWPDAREAAPGVDELTDAAVACFGQGHGDAVASADAQVLIGDAVGRITGRAAARRCRRSFTPPPSGCGCRSWTRRSRSLVHLAGNACRGRAVRLPAPPGRSACRSRTELRAGWAAGWRPGPAGAARAGARALGAAVDAGHRRPPDRADRLGQHAWPRPAGGCCASGSTPAQRVDAGTEVAAADGALRPRGRRAFPAALARCEALAADSASFPALARATYHLDGLLAYGAARKLPAERLLDLAGRLFARAVLHLPAAAVCGDEAADEVRQTLLRLHELVRRGRTGGRGGGGRLLGGGRGGGGAPGDATPACAGWPWCCWSWPGGSGPASLTAGCATGSRRGRRRRQRPAGGRALRLHRGTLVRNRALIGAVTEFLVGLELDQLTPLLPVLRRSLGSLSAAGAGLPDGDAGGACWDWQARRPGGRSRWPRPTATWLRRGRPGGRGHPGRTGRSAMASGPENLSDRRGTAGAAALAPGARAAGRRGSRAAGGLWGEAEAALGDQPWPGRARPRPRLPLRRRRRQRSAGSGASSPYVADLARRHPALLPARGGGVHGEGRHRAAGPEAAPAGAGDAAVAGEGRRAGRHDPGLQAPDAGADAPDGAAGRGRDRGGPAPAAGEGDPAGRAGGDAARPPQPAQGGPQPGFPADGARGAAPLPADAGEDHPRADPLLREPAALPRVAGDRVWSTRAARWASRWSTRRSSRPSSPRCRPWTRGWSSSTPTSPTSATSSPIRSRCCSACSSAAAPTSRGPCATAPRWSPSRRGRCSC